MFLIEPVSIQLGKVQNGNFGIGLLDKHLFNEVLVEFLFRACPVYLKANSRTYLILSCVVPMYYLQTLHILSCILFLQIYVYTYHM